MSIRDGISSIEKKGKVGEGKRVFLLLKKDITQSLKEGHAIKDVWQALVNQKALSITYRTFAHYVARFIPIQERTPETNDLSSIEQTSSTKSKQEKLELLKKQQELHNPIADKDSLI